jgi:peptidoglycan/LPS O-acetylase OafA/YrhL
MTSGAPPQASPLYVPSLTGIRALAALLVLGLHTTPIIFGSYPRGLVFLSRGYLGVDFFFLLSGFIITHVYLWPLSTPTLASVRVFLWHRIIRLYPVHLVMLAILVAMVGTVTLTLRPVHTERMWRFGDLVWHLLLMHAWGATESASWNLPSWSISAEWFAYLLFPGLAPLLARIGSGRLALGLAASALLGTATSFTLKPWNLSGSWVGAPALVRVGGEFLCGAALCRAVVAMTGRRVPARAGDWLGLGAFALFLLGAARGMPDFALVALLALTVAGAATARGVLALVLGSFPLRWLGETSYSLYMTHFMVLSVIDHPILGLHIPRWPWLLRLVAFAGVAGVCLLAAAIMYRVIERPLRLRLRDRAGLLVPS